MVKNIVETCFSIIYKKDNSFIVVHECEEITDSKYDDKIFNSFIIYSFCDSKGKIIKQNFSKNLEDKFNLENIEKATRIPLEYSQWVKMNIHIPKFEYEFVNKKYKDCYVHSLGFTMYFNNYDLIDIDIAKEFDNIKCKEIIHYNKIGYNPVVKQRNILINCPSLLVESITYKDLYNDLKIMFFKEIYKNFNIESSLKLIKSQQYEEKMSGAILESSNELKMITKINLDLKYKSYYKIGQKKDKEFLTRGNGLQINDRTKLLNLYNSDFNDIVLKVLHSIEARNITIYIDEGNLNVCIESYNDNFQKLLELSQTLKNSSMTNILGCLIDYLRNHFQ